MEKLIFNSFHEANEFAKSIAMNGGKPKLSREVNSYLVEYMSTNESENGQNISREKLSEEKQIDAKNLQRDSRQSDPKYLAQITKLKDKHRKYVDSLRAEFKYEGVTEKLDRSEINATKCNSCFHSYGGDINLVCNACDSIVCSRCGVCGCIDAPF